MSLWNVDASATRYRWPISQPLRPGFAEDPNKSAARRQRTAFESTWIAKGLMSCGANLLVSIQWSWGLNPHLRPLLLSVLRRGSLLSAARATHGPDTVTRPAAVTAGRDAEDF
jgi:hypothetical protein